MKTTKKKSPKRKTAVGVVRSLPVVSEPSERPSGVLQAIRENAKNAKDAGQCLERVRDALEEMFVAFDKEDGLAQDLYLEGIKPLLRAFVLLNDIQSSVLWAETAEKKQRPRAA